MPKQIGKLTKLPASPPHLSSEAKTVYRDTARYLLERAMLHSGDLPTLENYAILLDRLRQLSQVDEPVLTEDGELSGSTLGILRISSQLSRLATSLGCTPSARSKMTQEVRKAESPPADEDADWKAATSLRSIK